MSGRTRSFLTIGLEALLLSGGVFLGLLGDQWRDRAHDRDLAEASLQRFRAEIATNRTAVDTVVEYHTTLKRGLDAWLAAEDDAGRRASGVRMRGLRPVTFGHSAWDLAIATQSLGEIDPDLALTLSRIYNVQVEYAGAMSGMAQAMYLRPPSESQERFFATADLWLADVVIWEPGLLEMYDAALAEIDAALGDGP